MFSVKCKGFKIVHVFLRGRCPNKLTPRSGSSLRSTPTHPKTKYRKEKWRKMEEELNIYGGL